jgi:peptidoglycan/xylan/chitin deacetylase (PgdA/CDA1 family)
MNPLPVFLTVDTEIWPHKRGWPDRRLAAGEKDLARQFEHGILGKTAAGELGVRYQMQALNRHGLKATFFVEPLHAAVAGETWLKQTVAMIVQAGHDVQMHAHTEWLSDASDPELPPAHRQFLHQFPAADQVRILAWAKRRLERCGAGRIVAFRAGSFGASNDTLKALREIGVGIDSSYNRSFVDVNCLIEAGADLYQARPVAGVQEFPVTVFVDYPGHFKPVQLAACSAAETERMLMQAWRRQWRSFVILWHGTELLQPEFNPHGPARPSPIVVRRFERLCRFLAANRDKFRTPFFGDVPIPAAGPDVSCDPLNSNPVLTTHRLIEQVVGRFL